MKKAIIQKETCTPMFIAALFIITKTQKQPKWTSTDLKKMWYIYTMQYYLFIKKNKIMLSATWMDLGNITLSEISHTEKDKHHMILLIHGI